MSEISREEAIIMLRCNVTDILGENASGWKNEFCERTYNALSKAISDMEKLEKIEQLYEPTPFGEGLSREDRNKKIEQILKEDN